MQDTIALCAGCAARGASCRWGATDLVALGPTEALGNLECAGDFEGGPRVAHGGWTAAMFDDVMGRFLSHVGRPVVTATLQIAYSAPIPVETPLEVKVRILSNEGRRWTLAAAVRLPGDDRDLATANGVWVERRQDHFERHDARLAEFRRNREL